jgi:peptidoglycan-associated lipoprotein
VLTQNTGIRIRISGHTDNRGSDEYNLALGQRRAAAAKRYLTDRGIDGGRIEIVSFGEERPKCTSDDESCWSDNRRDEFEITVGEITAVQMSSTR